MQGRSSSRVLRQNSQAASFDDDDTLFNLTASMPLNAGETDDDDPDLYCDARSSKVEILATRRRTGDAGSTDDEERLVCVNSSPPPPSSPAQQLPRMEDSPSPLSARRRNRMQFMDNLIAKEHVFAGAVSRQRRLADVVRRVRAGLAEVLKESRGGGGCLSDLPLHRFKRVWVDATLLPHQEKYYGLLLLEFHRQLETGQFKQSITEMVGYLRIAANAVEMLPEQLLTQLSLTPIEDFKSLEEEFNEKLKNIPPLRRFNSRVSSSSSQGTLLGGSPSSHAEQMRCSVCFDSRAEVRIEPCGHAFHVSCMDFRVTECPSCGTQMNSITDAAALSSAVRTIGSGLEVCKLNRKCPWVLSSKYNKIIDCMKFELEEARKARTFVHFVVLACYDAMIEGFSRVLATSDIPHHVIKARTNKIKVKAILKWFGSSLDPRVLVMHSAAVSAKHNLSSTTHVYYMNPWRETEAQRVLLGCVLGDTIAGPSVLVADVVSSNSIEAEALQVDQDDEKNSAAAANYFFREAS